MEPDDERPRLAADARPGDLGPDHVSGYGYRPLDLGQVGERAGETPQPRAEHLVPRDDAPGGVDRWIEERVRRLDASSRPSSGE